MEKMEALQTQISFQKPESPNQIRYQFQPAKMLFSTTIAALALMASSASAQIELENVASCSSFSSLFPPFLFASLSGFERVEASVLILRNSRGIRQPKLSAPS